MARRVLHDAYFKQAKAEGYLARSAYKLQQIQEAKRLIRTGDRVLDLGCAPGAWLQVASELVGPKGLVVGIDLQEVPHRFPPVPPIVTLVGDIYKTPAETLLGAAPAVAPLVASPSAVAAAEKAAAAESATTQPKPVLKAFDVVLSDMAPNTSGHGDHEKSVALCEHVLFMLPDLLRKGGGLAMKVFEGGEYPRLLKETGRLFETTKGYKPKASRDASVEMYIIGLGYKRPVRT